MKGFIYKITSPSTDKIYIGSTTVALNIRFRQHKCLHTHICTSKTIMSLGDAVINLIEEVEFENRNELNIRERHHIELNRDVCVNKVLPSRTKKEAGKQYRIDNADKIRKRMKQYNIDTADERKQHRIDNADKKKEWSKQYRSDNTDKLHEKFNCECGGTYTHTHISTHLKTLIHQNYITGVI
jgi:hypothetical protein